MRRFPVLFLVLGVLSACASAPKINYYTLGNGSGGHASPPVQVRVERFRTTGALVPEGIMVSLSDTRVDYHPADRWAESLGTLVQRRLAGAFGTPSGGLRTVVLSGTVLACEEFRRPSGRGARLRLEVEVRDPERGPSGPPLLVRTYEVERPVSPGEDVAPVVEALAAALDELALRIAVDLGELPPG